MTLDDGGTVNLHRPLRLSRPFLLVGLATGLIGGGLTHAQPQQVVQSGAAAKGRSASTRPHVPRSGIVGPDGMAKLENPRHSAQIDAGYGAFERRFGAEFIHHLQQPVQGADGGHAAPQPWPAGD